MRALETPTGGTRCKFYRWLVGIIVPGNETNNFSRFLTRMGFVFICNIIVGTGAIVLPKAYDNIWWIYSMIVIVFLSLFSYMMVTFIVESMSNANIYKSWQHLRDGTGPNEFIALDDMRSDSRENSSYVLLGQKYSLKERLENMPLSYYPPTSIWYNIDDAFELGDLVSQFFSNIGRIIYYISISVYLYGDLIVSSSAAADSLRDSVCNYENNDNHTHINNQTSNMTSNDDAMKCWQWADLTRLHAYRLFVFVCILIFGSFTIVDTPMHETKVWKVMSICYRVCFLIFISCIILQLIIIRGQTLMNIYGLTCLLAAAIYALRGNLDRFCINNYTQRILCSNKCIMMIFSIVLATIPALLLKILQEFFHSPEISHQSIRIIIMVTQYFGKFFQFFTLSASFSIIALTLRNNLQCIFLGKTRLSSNNLLIKRILFSTMTLLPPFLTCFSESLTIFFPYVLSYVGTVIQYFVPVGLVYTARKKCSIVVVNAEINDYKSPFKSPVWLVIVMIWVLLWIGAVTYVDFFSPN